MKIFFYLFSIFFIFSSVSISQLAIAQTSQEISTLDIDKLSDAQLKDLMQRMQATGLSEAQMLQTAKNAGLSDSQIQRLRERIASSSGSDTTGQAPRKLNYTPANQVVTAQVPRRPGPRIFGEDLFNGTSSSFEPNLRLATPFNYILGPDDQLNVNVYGNSLDNWKLTVTPEGNINLPHVGVVNVTGKTIEQATAAIKTKLAANNYAIGRGTEVQVTLGDIRSIKVIIIGEVVKPGTYTLPSLATVFNALYSSGGPNSNGSFRKIDIIRNNRVVRKLDIYDFLLKGDQKDNIGLRDQDIIQVPTYSVRVEMSGEVKRPALYEVLPGETLQDVLNFSGGFTDLAYTSKVQALQVNDNERSIVDVAEQDFKNYTPLRGDKYIITHILESYKNRVTISGAVLRPGSYALDKGLTIGKLISKASGLRKDAFTSRGSLTRLKADNTPEIISFSVRDVIDNPASDILLLKEDLISISSILEFHDQYSVTISGEVRNPANYSYADSMTVENLIIKAGGLTEGASPKRIEISRRIDNTDPNSINGSIAQVFEIGVNPSLGLNSSNFVLKPFDIVSVYTYPGYEKQKAIKVEGEVMYPGYYTITQKNERISDLLRKAGGLTPSAFVEGGTLKREKNALSGYDKAKVDTNAVERDRDARLKVVSQTLSTKANTTGLSEEQLRNNFVGIDLKDIVEKPGSKTDLLLEEGDVLRVPKLQQTVNVNGEVLFPSAIVYSSGETFKGYIINAGGFGEDALRRRSYVVYPNGTVKGTKKFFFFNVYPSVKPGSEIYVPKKRPKIGLNGQEILGFAGGIASLGILIVGLINLTK